jgi:hypothetical protein
MLVLSNPLVRSDQRQRSNRGKGHDESIGWIPVEIAREANRLDDGAIVEGLDLHFRSEACCRVPFIKGKRQVPR